MGGSFAPTKNPWVFFKAKKQNPWRNSEAPRILGTLRLSNLQTNLVKPENFQISQTPKNKTVPLVFFLGGGIWDGVHLCTICRSRTWRRTKFEHWEVCLSQAQLEQWRGCWKHPLGDSCAARIFGVFHMH